MRIPFDLVLLALIVCGGGAKARSADRVSANEGRILIQDSSGQTTALTQSGLDSAPWLSPDGRTVVFIRQSAEDIFWTSVYKIDMSTRKLGLLYGGPARYHGRESPSFGRPELDESQETLFLLTNDYATEGSLIAIQLATGQTRLISDHVVGYDVIECTGHRGDLIVLKRRADILGHPYFLYWLYSPTGDDLGLAGADELDLDALRGGDCPAPQPSAPIPPSPTNSITTGATRVDAGVMEGRLVMRVQPAYPSEARSGRTQGDVRLLVRIAADGTVQDINLVSGPPQLVGSAMAAVRQWRYQPFVSDGHPVPVVTVVNVPFRLPSTEE